jgi:hypothetical protein
MCQTGVQKACYVCGEDVTHKSRHKNRRNQYVCPKCVEAKKRSSRTHVSQRLGVPSNLLFLYLTMALVGCWLFYKCLGVVVEAMMTP